MIPKLYSVVKGAPKIGSVHRYLATEADKVRNYGLRGG